MKLEFTKLVDLEISRNKQTMVNMIANAMSFAISLVISFFLSPYIVKQLGAEANGFVTLATNFVNYANLIKTALNGVGTRYIMVAYHKGDYEKASRYYSSLFFGDLFLSIVFAILSIACIWKLEHIINISENLVTDVKILFSFVFANFVFGTALTVFSSAAITKNKMYLQSIRDIQSYLIRSILLIVLFVVFEPKVFFLGLASFVPAIVVALYNIYYKSVLLPEIHIKKNYFSFSTIKELVGQGIWNSISSLGTILMTSLDLLIANILVGEKDMGILSIAKSMPNIISGLATTMGTVFFSVITIDYAKGNIEKLISTVKQSTRLVGFITTIPLAFLISYGMEFYSLWQPTLDAKQLHILSILTIAGFIVFAGTNNVGTLFTVTLHVKERSIVTLLTGAVSIFFTLLLLKTTNLGVYAIAGVSSVVDTISMVIYVIPFGAKYIGQKKTLFLPVVFRSVTSTAVLCAVGYLLKLIIPSNSWFTLIISATVFAIVSMAVNSVIMLDKETRNIAIGFIKSKINK